MIEYRQIWIADRLALIEKNLRNISEVKFMEVRPTWFNGDEHAFMLGYCKSGVKLALEDLKPVLEYLAEANKEAI